jgi:hypothetical protein
MITGRLELQTQTDQEYFFDEMATTSLIDTGVQEFLASTSKRAVDVYRVEGTWRWIFDIDSDEPAAAESVLNALASLTQAAKATKAVTSAWHKLAVSALVAGSAVIIVDIPGVTQEEITFYITSAFTEPMTVLDTYQIVPFKTYLDCLVMSNEDGERHIYSAATLEDLGSFEWMEHEFVMQTDSSSEGAEIFLSIVNTGLNILVNGECLVHCLDGRQFNMRIKNPKKAK